MAIWADPGKHKLSAYILEAQSVFSLMSQVTSNFATDVMVVGPRLLKVGKLDVVFRCKTQFLDGLQLALTGL
jgi:hypothetical protein